MDYPIVDYPRVVLICNAKLITNSLFRSDCLESKRSDLEFVSTTELAKVILVKFGEVHFAKTTKPFDRKQPFCSDFGRFLSCNDFKKMCSFAVVFKLIICPGI